MKNIKNYTSIMPVERSIFLIEQELLSIGAVQFSKFYKDGKIEGITFQLDRNDKSRLVPISLPSRVSEVFDFMSKELGINDRSRAERTAWKSLLEWVQIHVSFIKIGRVDALEAFLPYVQVGQHTYYQCLKSDGFLALENK